MIPTRRQIAEHLSLGVGTLTAVEVGILLGSNATSEQTLRSAAMTAARRGHIPPPVCGLDSQTRGWVWSVALVNRWLAGEWRPVPDELAGRRSA